jgi:type VI secretion system FHA domain protein
MSLILKVISFKNKPFTETIEVSIDNSGTIGRSDDNTLALPDAEKFVSRHHANIKSENGYYYLTDTSLGGVYINGLETPLHNATSRIDNGSMLKIGEYEISVSIIDDNPVADVPFLTETPAFSPLTQQLFQTDEQWIAPDDSSFNSLMTDSFPKHEELIQGSGNIHQTDFESALHHNSSPLFDSYTAPEIIPGSSADKIPEITNFNDLFSDPEPVKTTSTPAHSTIEEIPESFSFEDLFSETAQPQQIPAPTTTADFNDLFAEVISNLEPEADNPSGFEEDLSKIPESQQNDEIGFNDLFAAVITDPEPNASKPSEPETTEIIEVFTEPEQPAVHQQIPFVQASISSAKSEPTPVENHLFESFLQGTGLENTHIQADKQPETLYRIGQMFRKLLDGTVAVLRSRAEFKSLCRVNMTVIRATGNNPLKFTVSTDDVLKQLIENKEDGFLGSVDAIEQSYNDIMNHQLAMQAGIQASLTDLLKTLDPKIIEKQFEQGIVLQKKAKCWEKYEETYQATVDEAVENFFGEAFVKAYEKQMSLLTNSRKK